MKNSPPSSTHSTRMNGECGYRLAAIAVKCDDFIKLDLEEQIRKYVAELQSEMVELIHTDPQTPEERYQVFLLKKRVVDTILEEARIKSNIRKQVFRNIEKLFLFLELHPISGDQAVVCSEVGRNLYPYTDICRAGEIRLWI